MVILIDLDGTLTNTAHLQFKDMKDGLKETILQDIPIFSGAKNFINNLKEKGYKVIIVSDSHPKYVKKIASEIFDLEFVSLTDKPNPQKTLTHINSDNYLKTQFENKDNFLLIGDSYLDIELGRRLNVRTVLTSFYKASVVEERDGIGQDWKPIKMGPTFYAKTFDEVNDIISNPNENLLAIESIFKGGNSTKAVNFKFHQYTNGYIAFRCLARQNDGECDLYARADKYFQIDNPARTPEFLKTLALGAQNYIKKVLSFKKYSWHLFSYLSDKSTTTPPNKMKEIFDLIDVDLTKIKLFEWKGNIDGSLRDRPDYKSRREFISQNLFVVPGIDVNGKNIIIIDDQFTSSATAYEVSTQLRSLGAKNILFIALFYLILPIESKSCPNIINSQLCGKPLKIKIKKADGKRFYSCLPPKYGGKGCGYIENIDK